ncbi:MAG TPA: hypothetical protein VKZ88_03600 [Fibrobacteria bacterium]|nr:hypothetical protein [Fibrobacteria bacterium]
MTPTTHPTSLTPLMPLMSAFALAGLLAAPVLAEEPRTQNRNVTVVTASSSSDGSSEISREKVEDCILSLPDPQKLEPQITSQSLFVQGINGVAGRNEWIKSYTAHLDITYMTREKDLIIVTTRSVQGQPPVFREVEKTLRHTQSFTSNPAEGDTYAGRSNRQYYFTSAEAASRDVKERARAWITQQAPTVCGVK